MREKTHNPDRSAYGGDLLKTRTGRERPRPLAFTQTMHLVLRSSKAKGAWSFKHRSNERKILAILNKFSAKYGVRVLKLAVVLNHLHLQIKLESRRQYKAFIRAVTAAIAMAVTGASRWRPLKKQPGDRFWDSRPFTRFIAGIRQFRNLQRYIEINQLEGLGYSRAEARILISESFKRSAPIHGPG